MVRHLSNGTSKTINWVDSYLFSNDGSKLAVTLKKEKTTRLPQTAPGWLFFPTLHSILSTVINFSTGCPASMRPAHALPMWPLWIQPRAAPAEASLFMTDLTADLLSADEISLSIPQGSPASYEASRQKDPETQARLGKKEGEENECRRADDQSVFRACILHDGRREWLSAWLLMWPPTTPRL